MDIYLILVVVLFALAISDLVVGVSNDAVNFLNSAIGAKVAPFRIIILVAAIGVLIGATFSSGMMEVARNGIFHPQHFYFNEIMIIFLAVMITDVILLDLFNTFGMPTSTTVSIVFELLGAAVAVSLVKLSHGSQEIVTEGGLTKIADMGDYINTEKALGIISGILLSVVIAFSVGALVQWLSRLLFSFNYKKRLRYFGAIYGGLSITAIVYFMLIKGAKGASFMSSETQKALLDNSLVIMAFCFIGLTILFQLLIWLFNLNVLKVIVLAGTFALAMAFAGNDLVNFIGVPLAGFEAYKDFAATGLTDPGAHSMEILSGKVKTDTYMLIIAGLIMVSTLWLSRKARTVTKTSVDLSRQGEGDERFGSSLFARSLVRGSRNIGKSISSIVPQGLKNGINKQFDQSHFKTETAEAPSFDLIRASVNLLVAAMLIAFATSLKLPLSTTYVTFMVAMGTSLTDRAWGRDSAVYRITGVLSVIGGWFFTALMAFTAAFVFALVISWGGIAAIIGLILIALIMVIRTHAIHKKRTQKEEETEKEDFEEDSIYPEDVREKCSANVLGILDTVRNVYNDSINALISEDRKTLKQKTKEVKEVNERTKHLKDRAPFTITKLQEDSEMTSHYYVQVLDYLRETAHCLTYISEPSYRHIDNNHSGLSIIQAEDLRGIAGTVDKLFEEIVSAIKNGNYSKTDLIIQQQQDVLAKIQETRRRQIKRIKSSKTSTKLAMLYLNILHESKNMLLFGINLLKSQRDFATYNKKQ
ncbi:MAG: inorganic phosphate transporter [Bacteroidales bacterium]|nr:inorganic phosphate transporter [Bacteroidales bacterium]